MAKRNLVKIRRLQMEMTQLDLYTSTGIWPSRISNIEKGRWDPSDEEMSLIAEALKTTREALFPGRE